MVRIEVGTMSLTRIEGEIQSRGKRFAVVAAKWNTFVVDRLLESALQALSEYGVSENEITVVRVPGSFELPLAVQELASSGRYAAIIALGVLIRGETDHYQLVVDQVAAGLSKVMLETGVPVSCGVVAAHSAELALQRAGERNENRGFEAALTALEMASLMTELRAAPGR